MWILSKTDTVECKRFEHHGFCYSLVGSPENCPSQTVLGTHARSPALLLTHLAAVIYEWKTGEVTVCFYELDQYEMTVLNPQSPNLQCFEV